MTAPIARGASAHRVPAGLCREVLKAMQDSTTLDFTAAAEALELREGGHGHRAACHFDVVCAWFSQSHVFDES